MGIYLFTDFGAADIYVGQVKTAMRQFAPAVPVIDLLHEAPPFKIKAAAHLLTALAGQIPEGSVIFAVVDPGVGSARLPVVLQADGCWYVGPDNGLLSVLAGRAEEAVAFDLIWRPVALSNSFHGRDWFAPAAALLAEGHADTVVATTARELNVNFPSGDLSEIIYVDHYGNALTGIRSGQLPRGRVLTVAGREIRYARVFDETAYGELFWYENSIGLVEIAANQTSVSNLLNLHVGHVVIAAPA